MKKHRRARHNPKKSHQAANTTLSLDNADNRSLWENPYCHALLIFAVGILVYARTLSAPFLFDDFPYLVLNPLIRDFSFFADPEKVMNQALYADVKNNFILRPVTYFSFAVNYALHGMDVRGYHLVNLLLHLGNGLLTYLLCRMIFNQHDADESGEVTDVRCSATASYLPLFCALLFVCHPLQTQAVTYIIQRFVPLCTFFALITLVLYGYSQLATRKYVRRVSYLSSLAACVLAMLSKEIAFTLPMVMILFDMLFMGGNPKKRATRLFPFLLSMAIIPVNISRTATFTPNDDSGAISDAVNLVNFRGTSPWDYLMTQFGVIIDYLRLLILPVNQNFDYDYHLQKTFLTPTVVLPLIILLLIAGIGIWQLVLSWRSNQTESRLHALTAFGIFWFFATLSVSSSIVPIDDLIFEHRVYLPSIGFYMATLSGAALLYGRSRKYASLFSSRIAIILLAVAIIGYSIAGFKRNSVWGDKVTFWRDVVSKSPNKSRPHYRLGLALLEEPMSSRMMLEQLETVIDLTAFGIAPQQDSKLQLNPENKRLVDEAIEEFRTFIRIGPKMPSAHIELGEALLLKGDESEAVKEFATALSINPKSYLSYLSLGKMHERKKEYEKARLNYLKAIALAPKNNETHMYLAGLYAKEGNYDAALKEYELAWQLFPDNEVRKKIEKVKAKIRN